MSCLRWVQMLLLLLVVQPLALLAMPCHTGGAEQSAVLAQVEPSMHHSMHHAGQLDHLAGGDSVVSAPLSKDSHHSCCDPGSLCLMSGCAVSVFGVATAELRFSPSSAVFLHYASVVPDVPVPPLYRPPIFL